jgi:hypothetical protein
MRERQADRRWEEATEAGPEAARKTKRAEPALPSAQTEDDAHSESSEKHGQCVSASQMPTATRVAGFWAWKNVGRSVNAGAKGIRILRPLKGIRRKKDSEAEKDITKQNEPVLLGFTAAYVFDISQTNGAELPAMQQIEGDPGENIERLTAFVKSRKIQVIYRDDLKGAMGASAGGRIFLLSGQSKAEEFSTLVHEVAHLCCVRSYVA